MKKDSLSLAFFIFIMILSFLEVDAFSEERKILKGEKDIDLIKKGEEIRGTPRRPPREKRKIQEKDLERWEKWERGELWRTQEERRIAEERAEKVLQRLREEVFPNVYKITSFKGDISINDKRPNAGDRVEVKKDLIVMRGPSRVGFVSENPGSIEIRMIQKSDQRSRFYLCDMNNPLESLSVYYDPSTNRTIIDAGMLELFFELYVYDGLVGSVIGIPLTVEGGAAALAPVEEPEEPIVPPGPQEPDIPEEVDPPPEPEEVSE